MTKKINGIEISEIDCTLVQSPIVRRAIAIEQTRIKNMKPLDYPKESYGMWLVRKLREDIKREKRASGISA